MQSSKVFSFLGCFVILLQLKSAARPTAAKLTRDWLKAIEYGNKIIQEHETIPEPILFLNLLFIEKAINGESTRKVPPKFLKNHGNSIVSVIGLLRITRLGVDKCVESAMDVEDGNLHRASYVELMPFLKQEFPSDNIHRLIDFYYNNQFIICQNSLKAQFDRRATEYSKNNINSSKIVQFWNRLSETYPSNTNINQMNKQEKMVAVAKYLSKQMSKDDLKMALINHLYQVTVIGRVVLNECKSYSIEPFGTMMKTLDAIGRNNQAELCQRHEILMRAHDICLFMRDLHQDDYNIILTQLKHMIENNSKDPTPLITGYFDQIMQEPNQQVDIEHGERINSMTFTSQPSTNKETN